MQQQKREIPDSYERVEHHEPFTLHDPDRGIIIMVHKRDEIDRKYFDRYPYKVTGAKDQVGFYDGVFDSKSHAIDKAKELAQKKT